MRQILAIVMVGTALAFAAPAVLAESQLVSGTVTMKFNPGNSQDPLIAVDGTPYSVPYPFYASVQPGDRVRFDGSIWSKVK